MNGLNEYQIAGLLLEILSLAIGFGTAIGIGFRILKPYIKRL